MKKTLLMLVLGMASSSVFAASSIGEVHFRGTISGGGTCPIEVIERPGGPEVGSISLGSYTAGYFKSVGTRTPAVDFMLRITPGNNCEIQEGNTASVTYSSSHGVVGNDLYSFRKNGADGVGLAITDRNHKKVVPDEESMAYELHTDRPTEMKFHASYESFAETVTEGAAEAEISFVVHLL